MRKPGDQKRQDRQHEEHVDHVRVQVTDGKGIYRKLVDRLVIHIRAIPDISRRVREPVFGIDLRFLNSPQTLQLRIDVFVERIVHIAGHRYRQRGQRTRKRRPEERRILLRCHAADLRKLLKLRLRVIALSAVRDVYMHQVVADGVCHGKCPCCQKHHGDVVAVRHRHSRQLRHIGHEILTDIVVINAVTGQPHVCRRHVIALEHGHHKAVVHKALRAVRGGRNTLQVAPEYKRTEEDRLHAYDRADTLIRVELAQVCLPALLQVHQVVYQQVDAKHYTDHDDTVGAGKLEQLDRREEPHQPTCSGDTQCFGK